MKLATYSVQGKTSWGAVIDGGIVDLGARLPAFADVRGLIAGDGLAQAKAALEGAGADHGLADVVFLPPIPTPEKIVCV